MVPCGAEGGPRDADGPRRALLPSSSSSSDCGAPSKRRGFVDSDVLKIVDSCHLKVRKRDTMPYFAPLAS